MKIKLGHKEDESGDGYWAVWFGKRVIHLEDYEGDQKREAALRRCMAVISYLNGGERPEFGSWIIDDEYRW